MDQVFGGIGPPKLMILQQLLLAAALDAQVEQWNERPLSGTAYPFVWVDAMGIKVRRDGAVRPTSLLIATAVNSGGHREILGVRVADSESEASWLETFRWLKDRGLSGVTWW